MPVSVPAYISTGILPRPVSKNYPLFRKEKCKYCLVGAEMLSNFRKILPSFEQKGTDIERFILAAFMPLLVRSITSSFLKSFQMPRMFQGRVGK
jgi:hypothetical protein